VRILVIEDEAKTARFLPKGLGEAGFVVDIAGDGLDGLHLEQELQFDLIILDVMLPGLDGWQVLNYANNCEWPRALLRFHLRIARLITRNATINGDSQKRQATTTVCPIRHARGQRTLGYFTLIVRDDVPIALSDGT
jgi:hypothetical protein